MCAFLPDGFAGRGELAIPVGLFFLSAIPDGFSGKIRSWLVKPHPTGMDCFLSAIRQGIVPFPDELFLSADSRRLAVGKGIPDGFFVIPDGFWPTGISLFLVVIDLPNLTRDWFYIYPQGRALEINLYVPHPVCFILPPFQIVGRFDKSRCIIFAMNLDKHYV